MKFAARDGSAARTLAMTAPNALDDSGVYAAPGWYCPSSTERAKHTPASRPSLSADSGGATMVSSRSRNGRQTTLTFSRGQEVFTSNQGNGMVYIVRTGCVRLFKVLPDGRSINLGVLGPNTLFTQEDISDGIASGAVAEALVDSTISVIETENLASLITESPELAAAVVTGMTKRFTELQTLVEQLLVRDTAVRLATTLLNLAHRFGRPTADGMVAIALPLTHQGLANMIGSNRVTVTRKLLDLQESAHLRSLGRNALAVSPDKLRDYIQTAGEAR
ncbi:MAG: Crp/Fnr family transcriptional regulator [Thermomicrobiales bacterium]